MSLQLVSISRYEGDILCCSTFLSTGERVHLLCQVQFVSIPSQETSLGKRLRNDLFCVEWDVKPQLNQCTRYWGQSCPFSLYNSDSACSEMPTQTMSINQSIYQATKGHRPLTSRKIQYTIIIVQDNVYDKKIVRRKSSLQII